MDPKGLEEFVSDLTKGLDELRSGLASWSQDGPSREVSATSGGVTARATLAAGLTALELDATWVQEQETDEIARCAVRAVNEAEASAKAQVWQALGDLRLGPFSMAQLGDEENQRRFAESPDDFVQEFTTADEGNGDRP